MDNERLDEMLQQIITDRRYIVVADQYDNIREFAVRNPTSSELNYSRHLYRRCLRNYKYGGLPSEKEVLRLAMSRGEWKEEYDSLIKLYRIEIEKLKETTDPNTGIYKHNKGKKQKVRMEIIKRNKKIEELENKRVSLISITAEYSANIPRHNYILSRVILSVDGTQYWPKYEDFEQERDATLIANIVIEYGRMHRFNEKEYRQVARGPAWNLMWNSSKKSGDSLFGRNTSNYTPEQLQLTYWSMMYDNVYESMDKPSDKIIENRNVKKRRIESGVDKHGEIFIMTDSEKSADEIYDMNNKLTMARLRKEIQRIEGSGKDGLSEFELRKGLIIKDALMKVDTGKAASARKSAMRRPQFVGGR
jgi:hypothetical protein